jgi:uncharacterized protein (DUF2252 family)
VPVADLPGGGAADDSRPGIARILAVYQRTLPLDRQHLLNRFRVTDAALKVVGVGSVGTQAWIMLMEADDGQDPLLLQAKQAQRSVLTAYAGESRYDHHGERVVVGQRLMQAASDIFLGWQRIEAGLDGRTRDFYVRQLRDWKFSVEISLLRPEGLQLYAGLCGWTLARAHARSGDRIAIAAYLGGSDVFDRAIARFATAYADQNERDYQALTDAVKSGRITAEHGL